LTNPFRYDKIHYTTQKHTLNLGVIVDLISKIEDLKNFGIDLKLTSKEMEVFYMKSMYFFFQQKQNLHIVQLNDLEIEVSTDLDPLASVIIEDSVLKIVPLGDNPYAVLMDVLEFVANMHKPTVALWSELQEGGEELANKINNELEEPSDNSDDEEDSDSDDMEWI